MRLRLAIPLRSIAHGIERAPSSSLMEEVPPKGAELVMVVECYRRELGAPHGSSFTKLSTTFFIPALSNATVNFDPSETFTVP